MTIQHFDKFDDIPEIERFLGILPVFATQESFHLLKETGNYSTIWFYEIANLDIQIIIPFAIRSIFFYKRPVFNSYNLFKQ